MKKRIVSFSLWLAMGLCVAVSCRQQGNETAQVLSSENMACSAGNSSDCARSDQDSGSARIENGDSPTAEIAASMEEDGVFLYYFHTKKRCATCLAIQENSTQVVQDLFQTEISSGSFRFLVVDLSDEANAAIADKYKVTWSSLYLVTRENGQEKIQNLTELGFKKARKDPQGFQKDLAEAIGNALL